MNLKNKTPNWANNQNRNRVIDMEIIWRIIKWEGDGREWGNGTGIKIKW